MPLSGVIVLRGDSEEEGERARGEDSQAEIESEEGESEEEGEGSVASSVKSNKAMSTYSTSVSGRKHKTLTPSKTKGPTPTYTHSRSTPEAVPSGTHTAPLVMDEVKKEETLPVASPSPRPIVGPVVPHLADLGKLEPDNRLKQRYGDRIWAPPKPFSLKEDIPINTWLNGFSKKIKDYGGSHRYGITRLLSEGMFEGKAATDLNNMIKADEEKGKGGDGVRDHGGRGRN